MVSSYEKIDLENTVHF